VKVPCPQTFQTGADTFPMSIALKITVAN